MKNRTIYSHKEKIDDAFKKVILFNNDVEIQAHWARYLCILVSGFVENSVKVLLTEYIENKSHENIVRYANIHLDKFQNPKMGKIIDLVNSFNPEWGKKLEEETEGELETSIDSIVANRNNIAHGKFVGITYSNISVYYQNSIKVLDLLESLIT